MERKGAAVSTTVLHGVTSRRVVVRFLSGVVSVSSGRDVRPIGKKHLSLREGTFVPSRWDDGCAL